MMAAVFASLVAAFVLDLIGWQRLAVGSLLLSLALGVWLFLWEVYSPDYGFRMPWLQVELKREHQIEDQIAGAPLTVAADRLNRQC